MNHALGVDTVMTCDAADDLSRQLMTAVLSHKAEIDRLRAELALTRAAIARVRAVLADPPVPSRMLIPVIRDAIEGRPVNICICCGARLGEFQNINNEWACGPCVEWETK